MGKQSKAKRAAHSQKPRHKRRSKPQETSSKLPRRWFSLLSPTGMFCAWIVLILTVVCSYYAFTTKLSITPTNPVDQSNPFSTPFVLRNDSLLWINLVNPYTCTLNNVKTIKATFNNVGVTMIYPSIPQLESGESTTFSLLLVNKLINNIGHIKYADVEIVVFYYPAFFPSYKILEKKYRKRFVAYYSKNGTLQWEHKAKSE